MQEDKRNLADSILSGDMGGITQMSKEELMELLVMQKFVKYRTNVRFVLYFYFGF